MHLFMHLLIYLCIFFLRKLLFEYFIEDSMSAPSFWWLEFQVSNQDVAH